jgi:hypothetical protein
LDNCALDWLLPREVDVLLARCGAACALDGCDEADWSRGLAASSSEAKLFDDCAESERLDLDAAFWLAVLAEMSDVTLNTLEPLAMKLNRPGSARSGPFPADFYFDVVSMG